MNERLKRTLEQIGWNELYSQYIPNLTPENERGERRARSPFPDVVDNNPSFSVNVQNGFFKCFKTNRQGDYVVFRAYMEPDKEDYDSSTGEIVPNIPKTQRRLIREFNVVRSIDLSWVGFCRDILSTDQLILGGIQRLKPWSRNTLYNLNVGYDTQSDRFIIPIAESNGHIVNLRMYRPHGTPKIFWYEKDISEGSNLVFPHIAWGEQNLILVEGEPDVISLRSYGFQACSGTSGAGNPVPEGPWYYGKTIYVWMDCDAAGKEAESYAIALLKDKAKEVRIVTTPEWSGRPDNADASDYIMYLISIGYSFEQIQREISKLITDSVVVDNKVTEFDQEAINEKFESALSSSHVNRKVSFIARIHGKSSKKHILPTEYSINCPASGHTYCQKCPMNTTYRGNGRFFHDPRSPISLKLIEVSDQKQHQVLKQVNGIPTQCPDPVITIEKAVDVEQALIGHTIHHGEDSGERSRRDAYIIGRKGTPEENRDYAFESFVYPHPETQQAVFLVDSFSAFRNKHEVFELDDQIIADLRKFSPTTGETVHQKLNEVADDLANSYSFIYGRRDLHKIYRTVWHSIIRFPFRGKMVERGWIECLILGDTRCGKSAIFKELSKLFGIGVLVDCKLQTLAGILGTAVQSPSGDWYAVAGILPQQDNGIICFDEFHSRRGGSDLIEVLSSTRAEGVVRISKAAQAEFRARVRSIWLANPGEGKLMSELSYTGVELINRLIKQPEDIARFDIAAAVSQDDVESEIINEGKPPIPSRYGEESYRNLIAWTYSRKPEQIFWYKDAEQRVLDRAIKMSKKYDSSIPLVEISDQRTRIAKISVSIAAQCFSTDQTGQFLIVTPDHVEAAYQLLRESYDSRVMAYDVYSMAVSGTKKIVDEKAVIELINRLKPYSNRFVEELLRLDHFSRQSLTSIVPIEFSMFDTLVGTLSANRCIQLVDRGRKDSYEKTPAFTKLLKKYIHEHKNDV
jgi:hypothetical protein